MAACRSQTATVEALPAQLGEEAFDRVEPGSRGRDEVKDEAGVPAQPGPHLGMLMSGVIVEHHVDDPAGRHLTFDGIEKPDKLLMPVMLHAAANDLALQHVERGKQGGCAVPLVIVGHRPATPALQRQPRLRAIKRLDLRPLVERQDERMRRRIDIETDNIAQLGAELRIAGQLELAHPMRLQPVRAPDATAPS